MAKPSLAYFVVICLTAVPASKSILDFIDQHPFSEKKSTSLWTALHILVHAPLDGVPLFWGPAPTPRCTVPIFARAGAGELFQFIRMWWPRAGHSNQTEDLWKRLYSHPLSGPVASSGNQRPAEGLRTASLSLRTRVPTFRGVAKSTTENALLQYLTSGTGWRPWAICIFIPPPTCSRGRWLLFSSFF